MRNIPIITLTLLMFVSCPVFSQELVDRENLTPSQKAGVDNRYINMSVNANLKGIPLNDPNKPNIIIAYAYLIRSTQFIGTTRPTSSIIFAPGFSINLEDTKVVSGERDSYLDSFDQLTTERFEIDVTDNQGNAFRTQSISYIDFLVSQRGYDVWFVDYLEDTVRVQQNSLAVQDLIRKTPLFRGNANKNYIFGYSMGGIVSRHALLALQSDNIGHNISAYVSLDAPHRGAFIPPAVEVVGRTIPRMADGGFHSGSGLGTSRELKRSVRDVFKKALVPLDSPAARQLLGLYIGEGVPKQKKNFFSGHTGRYRDYIQKYASIAAENIHAPDIAFYELREELIELGGYPRQTLNIGVSFGAADGRILRDATLRPGIPLSWDIRQGKFSINKIASADYKVPRGYNLCRVEYAGRTGRSCPPLRLIGGHLDSILVSPGSFSDFYKRMFDQTIGADNNVPGDDGQKFATLAMPGLGIFLFKDIDDTNAKATLAEGEEFTTFIPMVSAWDDDEWAYTYLNNDGQTVETVDTPFDVLVSNPAGQNMPHNEVSIQIRNTIERTLTDFGAEIFLQDRTGQNPLANGGSSYFNAVGVFDIGRYQTVASPREIPISDNHLQRQIEPPARNISPLAASIIGAID